MSKSEGASFPSVCTSTTLSRPFMNHVAFYACALLGLVTMTFDLSTSKPQDQLLLSYELRPSASPECEADTDRRTDGRTDRAMLNVLSFNRREQNSKIERDHSSSELSTTKTTISLVHNF